MSNLTTETRQIYDILTSLISSHDTATIRQAEQLLQLLLDQHVEKVIESFLILMNPQAVQDMVVPPHMRSFCVVLLTKHLPKGEDDLMSRLPDTLQTRVKHDLLHCQFNEQSAEQSRHFIHAIVAVAEVLLFKDEWPELFPFLFNCVSTPSRPEIRLYCLQTLALLTTNCFESLNVHQSTMERMLADCLIDSSMFTKQYAIDCLCKVLGEVVHPEARQAFRKLCPGILVVVKECVTTRQYTHLKPIMLQLISVTSESHELYFFKPYLEEFIDVMGKIAAMSDIPDNLRQFALEFLVSVILEEPALCTKAKYKTLLSSAMTACCQLMMTIPVDWSEWAESDGQDDNESEGNFQAAFDAVGRLGEVVRGKVLVAQVFPVLKSLFARPDWRFKHTAVSCLTQLVGAVTLGQFPCQEIFNLINTSNIRVRSMAIQFVGVASEYYAPNFQASFHQFVLPLFLKCGSEPGIHLLHEQVCVSLVSFISQCNDSQLTHYSENLMKMQQHFLQHGNVRVQKEAISAIATLAGACPEPFMGHYSKVMIHLRQLLVAPQNTMEIQLRCKAIEGMSYIGLAVGKELFYNDAKLLVDLFMSLQKSNAKLSSDDDADQYLLCAMARICPILGVEFSPCLPYILPPLLEAISHEPNNAVRFRDTRDDDLENPLLKMKQATKQIIDSIEDKTVMISMLDTFVSELKELYYPYQFSTQRTIAKYLDYAQSDELQQHAIQLVPSLVKCGIHVLKITSPNSVDEEGNNIQMRVYALILECIQYLLPCVLKQTNNILLLELLSSLYDILTVLCEEKVHCFDQAVVSSIVEEFLRVAIDAAERTRLRLTTLKGKSQQLDIQSVDGGNNAENTLNSVENGTLDALTPSKVAKLNVSDCYIVEQMFEVLALLARLEPPAFYVVFEHCFADIQLFTAQDHLPEIKRNPFLLYAALFQYAASTLSHAAVEAMQNVCFEQLGPVGQGGVLERAAFAVSCCIDSHAAFMSSQPHLLTRCTSSFVLALNNNMSYQTSKELEDQDATRELEQSKMDEDDMDSTTQFLFSAAGTSREMQLYAQDNITCVLGKITFVLGQTSALPSYLAGLPIKVDVQEGDKTYTLLCTQIHTQALLQHVDIASVCSIVQILCSAVAEEDREEIVRAQLCETLAFISQQPQLTTQLTAIPTDNQPFVKDTFQKALQFMSSK